MLIDVSLRASDRQLRWFAGLWLPCFCLLVGSSAARRQMLLTAYGIWASGAVLSGLGLARPSAIRPLYDSLIWLGSPIAWIASHAIFAVLYYVVITPIGAVVRLFHDPMTRSFDPDAESSYWSERGLTKPERYLRQF